MIRTLMENHERVSRCVEHQLKKITAANNCYFEAVVVERGKDPAIAEKDEAKEFNRRGAAIFIGAGIEDRLDTRTSGYKRYKMTYPLMCICALSDKQRKDGLTIIDLQGRMVDDIKTVLDNDAFIRQAADELGLDQYETNRKLSCINHHVENLRGGEESIAPLISFDVIVSYEYDVPVTRTPQRSTLVSTVLTSSVDSLLSASKTLPIFSTQDHTNIRYDPSDTCWARPINLTCMSPWNSVHVHLGSGTLVTPQHLISAGHFSPEGYIRFVGRNGEVITRYLEADDSISGTDIRIMKLDAPVPDCITPAKILPSNWQTYIPSGGLGLPILFGDQEEHAVCANLYTAAAEDVKIEPPTDALRLAQYEAVITGDSSNPIFLILNGEVILLATFWQFYGDGRPGGPSVAYYKDQINAKIAGLGGGPYTMTEADFSTYASV